jgi:hypothetical protein
LHNRGLGCVDHYLIEIVYNDFTLKNDDNDKLVARSESLICMNKQTVQIPISRLVLMFIVGVGAGALLLFVTIYLIQNGLPKPGFNQNARNMPVIPVSYAETYRMVNYRVQVKGYVIITNDTKNICGVLGWSTCKVWFDDDPMSSGLGLHEVKINVGKGPDSVTPEGDLYDHAGNHLKMSRTEQFGWYHVSVTGIVEKCANKSCTIDVDTISGLP